MQPRGIRLLTSFLLILSVFRLEAGGCGFFRVRECGGRWTAVDPSGRPFAVLGIEKVDMGGMPCEALGYSPYGRYCREHYPDKAAWVRETSDRLRAWGFNMLAAGCDTRAFEEEGFADTEIMNFGPSFCQQGDECWISPFRNSPCTALPNMFHPDFRAHCEKIAAQVVARHRGSPRLFGYYLDNELAWGGRFGSRMDTGVFDTISGFSETHSARRALESFVAGREVTRDLKVSFLRFAAERYFSIATEAVRRADPDHLVLGCRFAGLEGAHLEVWKAAAAHSDAVTFNLYPWADIERNRVYDRRNGRLVTERLEQLYGDLHKPFIITEWSFSALDTGRSCSHGSGQRFRTQAERVRASALFARTLLSQPFVLGYNFFMWVDQPAEGLSRAFKENCNYGLVNERNEPYEDLTKMFSRLHGDVERWRQAPVPVSREIPYVSEIDRYRRKAGMVRGEVRFRREKELWSLTNESGLTLSGRIGAGPMIRIAADGRALGTYGSFVETNREGRQSWLRVGCVTDVRFVREGDCGVLTVLGDGSDGGIPFEHRFLLAPGRRSFAAEIVRTDCPDGTSLVYQVLLPEGAAIAESDRGNVWGVPFGARWRFGDEATLSVTTDDRSVRAVQFWTDRNGAHGDIRFEVKDSGVKSSVISFEMPNVSENGRMEK